MLYPLSVAAILVRHIAFVYRLQNKWLYSHLRSKKAPSIPSHFSQTTNVYVESIHPPVEYLQFTNLKHVLTCPNSKFLHKLNVASNNHSRTKSQTNMYKSQQTSYHIGNVELSEGGSEIEPRWFVWDERKISDIDTEAMKYEIHVLCLKSSYFKQEFVRPRWPYDMRPSARDEKYMCHCNSLGGATWRSITGRTDGRTDRQTDRQSATQYAAPSEGGGPHNKTMASTVIIVFFRVYMVVHVQL